MINIVICAKCHKLLYHSDLGRMHNAHYDSAFLHKKEELIRESFGEEIKELMEKGIMFAWCSNCYPGKSGGE